MWYYQALIRLVMARDTQLTTKNANQFDTNTWSIYFKISLVRLPFIHYLIVQY